MPELRKDPVTDRWVIIAPERSLRPREPKSASSHYEQRERCLFCDIIRQELRDRSRLVYDSDAIVGFAPYASRFPFEVWLLPKRHQPFFEATDDGELQAIARALSVERTVLR